MPMIMSHLSSWHPKVTNVLVSVCIVCACFGTLIVWTVLISKMMHSAANNNILPQFLKQKNSIGVPTYSFLILSIMETIVVLLLHNKSLLHQLYWLIDASVTSSISIYLFCIMACIKLFYKDLLKLTYSLLALVFHLSLLAFIKLSYFIPMIILFLILSVTYLRYNRHE